MGSSSKYGLFVPQSNVWDIEQLNERQISPELKLLLVRLYQDINAISIALNLKDSGYYNTLEDINSQQWFPNPMYVGTQPLGQNFRPVFRTLVNFGFLPNASPKSVNHNILVTVGYTFTRIYATASDTTGLTYIPIPYVATSGNIVQLDVNSTQVTITTNFNATNYNVCYVILEYIKY